MKAKFTGHDTFPLRYGWLFKAVDHLNSNGKFSASDDSSVRDSIVKLGVGKNMVKAIQYWAESSGIIKNVRLNGAFEHYITDEGKLLFGDYTKKNGVDPYLEQLGSIWLLHFWLNFNNEYLTAYRYFFNFANVQHFEKTKIIDDCYNDSRRLLENDLGNTSTIKKDVDCFLNTYCKKSKNISLKNNKINEDYFTSPLSELNLILDNGNGYYISNLSDRPDLPIEIFIYSMLEFFKRETAESNVSTIDFDSLLTKPYSPGRIFRLSEAGLGQKLDETQKITDGEILWVDTLGLRQVSIAQSVKEKSIHFLYNYYGKSND